MVWMNLIVDLLINYYEADSDSIFIVLSAKSLYKQWVFCQIFSFPEQFEHFLEESVTHYFKTNHKNIEQMHKLSMRNGNSFTRKP